MSLAFCGNTTLAAGGSDNTIYLWDIAARDQRAKLEGHTGSVSSLVFHPQTRKLISGSFDTTVRVWNLADQLQREVSLPIESTTRTR
jgi:WD40 repeat protein